MCVLEISAAPHLTFRTVDRPSRKNEEGEYPEFISDISQCCEVAGIPKQGLSN